MEAIIFHCAHLLEDLKISPIKSTEEHLLNMLMIIVVTICRDIAPIDGFRVLDNMRRICNLNKLNCRILGLTWGEWDAHLFDLHPQILLGADVLYDTTDFDDLFATVAFLLRNSPGSVFITAYHNRSGHHLIEFMMVKWGLKCIKLLDGFSFMPPVKASSLRGNIQLVEIMPDGQQSPS